MYKAYDTILQSEVDAVLAAKIGDFEPYRYECACCGEEVHICATESSAQTVHFRHKNGNNKVECEKYLGNNVALSTVSRSHCSIREKVEIYYSNFTQTFSLGLKFSSNEIDEYEKKRMSLEIRTNDSTAPVQILSVTNINFAPDEFQMVPLIKFSDIYFISNTSTNFSKAYVFFEKDKKNVILPSFFKIQGSGDDENFKAKLVRSRRLFTNKNYLFVFPNPYYRFPSLKEVEIKRAFVIETMERKFSAVILSFLDITLSLRNQLKLWNYNIEHSESYTLLWPPAPLIEDTFLVETNEVFSYSSFLLQAHGNVNLHSQEINRLSNGVTKLSINQTTKISQRNVDVTISIVEGYNDSITSLSKRDYMNCIFVVPNGGQYYLFNDFGVRSLISNETVFMTKDSEIKKYIGNYFVGRVNYCSKNELNSKELLLDILHHYKVEIPFEENYFNHVYRSGVVAQYIAFCKNKGLINAIVKQFIMEELL